MKCISIAIIAERKQRMMVTSQLCWNCQSVEEHWQNALTATSKENYLECTIVEFE